MTTTPTKLNTNLKLTIIGLGFVVLSTYFIFQRNGNNTGQTMSHSMNSVHKDFQQPLIDWSSIPKLKSPSASEMSLKWVVVTSINYPTDAIKKLALLKDWKMVIVGDRKSPKDWNWPNCIFLDVNKQQELGYQSLKLLPYGHYGRKHLGYLYAIQHGARIIYETDDDNLLRKELSTIFYLPDTPKEYHMYSQSQNETLVNPYGHFGQPTVWPRGYPIQDIAEDTQQLFIKAERRPLIQQGLANGDPDVDALFRLTRKDKGVRLDISFDDSAQPVLLPSGSFCPWNSQNTLFHYDALWGMLIPVTTNFRVCDIWRSYWVQRILWEVNGNVAFIYPTVDQFRNVHDYYLDYEDEKPIYTDAKRFVNFLNSWKSTKQHLFDRIIELGNALATEGFWEAGDAALTGAWLHDLIAIGYQPPNIIQDSKSFNQKTVTLKRKDLPSSYLRGKLCAL